jgi:Na+/H+ antiporter NhaD/arsenite permease-like protein
MDHGEAIIPNPWMMLPFGLLLAMIALGPLFFLHWWEKHYPKVAYVLGAITLGYYLFGLHAYHTVSHTAIEYVSFIALVGSLYVVSGGIHITVKGEATPFNNVVFLLVGAILANILGTTGASMLMIRPWIRMNKYRITAHHIVFFIFIVSNVGGCLTPIGDPPLFLGFLKGIPFWWVLEKCWPMWLAGIGILLTMFYVVDKINYRKAPKEVREEIAEPPDIWRFEGLINLVFLGVILVAVFISTPLFLREALMLAAAVASYKITKEHIHRANQFNFHPIQEVAILFIGIFCTMMPALDWLKSNASAMQETSPSIFYWGTGLLSGVLDNAPTYLSFLSASMGKFANPEVVAGALNVDAAGLTEAQQINFLLQDPSLAQYIVAISVAAVFFGANTYIGNGPNFMVKSIADQQKVNAPTFLGYVFKFTIPYMIPMVLIIWFLFFR